jgi:hypothetical protein
MQWIELIKHVINWIAAIAAFASAYFWFKSASFHIPDPPAGAFAQAVMPALAEYRVAVRKAALSNRWAAAFSGVAALLTSVGLVM